VARQSRAERRARRQQATQEPALAGAGGGGGKPPVALTPEPPAKPERSPRDSERRRGGIFGTFGRFVVESYGELRKTEWPSQNHVIQGTIVVIAACIIMGTFIYVADIVSRHLVQDLLLR
jgi:preprotein translocase subunit SecE